MKSLEAVREAWSKYEDLCNWEQIRRDLHLANVAKLMLRFIIKACRQEEPRVQKALIQQAWEDFKSEIQAREFYVWQNVYATRSDPHSQALLDLKQAIEAEEA